MEKTRQYPAVNMGRTVGYQGRLGLTGVAARIATLALLMPIAATASAEDWVQGMTIQVPSGQDITFLDVIEGTESAVDSALRYRFLALKIARDQGGVAFLQVEEDMSVLCQDHVLPHITASGVEVPAQIIIVLSDRNVEFGVADPDATQFFEAYRPQDGLCIWEGF